MFWLATLGITISHDSVFTGKLIVLRNTHYVGVSTSVYKTVSGSFEVILTVSYNSEIFLEIFNNLNNFGGIYFLRNQK